MDSSTTNNTTNTFWNEQLANLIINANNSTNFNFQPKVPEVAGGYETLLLALAKLPINPYANIFNNRQDSNIISNEKLNLVKNLLSPFKNNFGNNLPLENAILTPPPSKRVCLDINSKNEFLSTSTCLQNLRTTTTPVNNIK